MGGQDALFNKKSSYIDYISIVVQGDNTC